MFEVAALIDEGRFDEALRALQHLEGEASTDRALLHARALVGAGRNEEGRSVLERLASAPLLDPELRAGAARLLLELGDTATGFEQAEQALEDDPAPELVRLTYAWAAVRTARRFEKRTVLLEEASRLLENLRPDRGPHAVLVQALRASVAAELDDPRGAIAVAQRALGAAPGAPDALAAVALASAKLGRSDDSRQAWLELSRRAPAEAEAMAARIERLGLSLPPDAGKAVLLEQVWEPAELALVGGGYRATVAELERICAERLERVRGAGARGRELPVVATVAASVLTNAPASRHFAPFDFSLWSIGRVEAFLTAVFGTGRLPNLPPCDDLEVLVGVYVGETVRQCHGGRWTGGLEDARSARVVAEAGSWSPVDALSSRLRSGSAEALPRVFGTTDPVVDTRPWLHRIAGPEAPPAPWGSATWPSEGVMQALGQAFGRSPPGVYGTAVTGLDLDRSAASLEAVDRYLDVIAPAGAPADPGAPWIPRLASIVGAYLGEVLRGTLGGQWARASGAEGADELEIRFPGGVVKTPVSWIVEELERGERSKLSSFVEAVAREVEARG